MTETIPKVDLDDYELDKSIGEGNCASVYLVINKKTKLKYAAKIFKNDEEINDFDKEIVFTERAKRVLETAWKLAKKDNKTKIESAHMLLALTTEPNSLAMKALEQLGVDAVEIKEGVKKFQEAKL